MKRIIIVNSASDFTIVDGLVQQATYIIQKEIDLIHDLHFGTGCELIFQGGKLSGMQMSRYEESNNGDRDSLNTHVVLTGDYTVLIAPMSCIVNGFIDFAGTWKVEEAYPEWFESNTNDATRINKALHLLKDVAGVLRLTGTYTINSPIIVPPHVNIIGTSPTFSKIMLQNKDGVDANNYDIFDVDDDRWISERQITTVINNVTHTLVKKVRAAIYFQSYRNADGINSGCGAKNLKVYMNGCACHAFYIERAYDKTMWENIEVVEVHHSFNAFRFTVPYEFQDSDTQSFDTFELVDGSTVPLSELDLWNSKELSRCGQTLLVANCWGLQNPYQTKPHFLTSPVPPTGKVIAPTYYFYNQQEINVIGCKSGANQTNTYRIDANTMRNVYQYGGMCMHFEGCRGVNINGCSVGGANVGIAITSRRRNSEGFTISGLTSEGIVHLDLMVKGEKYESVNSQGNTVLNALHVVRKLYVTPIRHEDSAGNIYLEECYMSDINALVNGQDIYVMPRDYMLNVYSTRAVTYVNPVMNFNPAIQIITGERGHMVPGSSNVIYSNANLKIGMRFLERITISGRNDSNGMVIEDNSGSGIQTDSMAMQVHNRTGIISLHDTNKVKMSSNSTLFTNTQELKLLENESSNPILIVNKPAQNENTCLTILVKDAHGNELNLPVKIGSADANGKCQLYIQLPNG